MTTATWQQVSRYPASSPSGAESAPSGFGALLRPQETWFSFLLLAILSLSTVWTVEGANWVAEMPGLTGFALMALLWGYILAKIKVHQLLLHPVGAVVGLLFILWQTVNSASGEIFTDKIVDAVVRLNKFGLVLLEGGISIDGLPFVTQILIFTWLAGYCSSWFLYRSQNVWLAILPPGIALVINLTYLPARFGFNFLLFMVAALVLIMYMHNVRQQMRWRLQRVPQREIMGTNFVAPLVGFALVVLGATFWLPLLEQSLPITLAWEQATGPWRNFEREFDRLFASVSSGKAAPLHSFGRAMPFRGAVTFGDDLPLAGRLGVARDVVVWVKADEPGYWRAESYDVYTGQGWLASDRNAALLPQDPVPGAFEEYQDRRPFTQVVTLSVPLDIMFARGMPIFGNTQAVGEVLRPASYTMQLSGFTVNQGYPQDIRNITQRLSQTLRGTGQLFSRAQLQQELPPDLAVVRATRRHGELDGLQVRRTDPFPPDYQSFRPQGTLAPSDQYSITSSVTIASVEKLQATGRNYPGWVTDRYLQVPTTVTPRIKELALEWTEDSRNPYDIAWAIETKLREITYSTNIPPPPRGTDGVEHFLFTLNRGYADYYSSAMVVMLRSLGIPSRISVGYVSGDWDEEQELYVVREAHAHAWVEVFFPDYGWVEFNPSPNWPTVPRIFDTLSFSGIDDYFDEDYLNDEFFDEDFLDEFDPTGDAGAGVGTDIPRLLLRWGIVAALMLLAWLVLRLAWNYGLRGLSLPAQLYEKVSRFARFARLYPLAQQTPAEYAQTLAAAVPGAQRGINEITEGYVRDRYSNRGLSPSERRFLTDVWKEIRGQMFFKALRFWERPKTRRRER